MTEQVKVLKSGSRVGLVCNLTGELLAATVLNKGMYADQGEILHGFRLKFDVWASPIWKAAHRLDPLEEGTL